MKAPLCCSHQGLKLTERVLEAVDGYLEVVASLKLDECWVLVGIVLDPRYKAGSLKGAGGLVRHRACKDCRIAHRAANLAEVEMLESTVIELKLEAIRIEALLSSDASQLVDVYRAGSQNDNLARVELFASIFPIP